MKSFTWNAGNPYENEDPSGYCAAGANQTPDANDPTCWIATIKARPSPAEVARRLEEFSPNNPKLVLSTAVGAAGGAEISAGIEAAAAAGNAATAAGDAATAAGDAAAEEASEGPTIYRVWGGKARPWGSSWADENPFEVTDFRDAAGLPNANTGQYVTVGRLVSGPLETRAALPLDGNAGGLHEILLLGRPQNQVQVIRVIKLLDGHFF